MGRTHRYAIESDYDMFVDARQEAEDYEAALYFEESEMAREARLEAEMEARCEQADEDRRHQEWVQSPEGQRFLGTVARFKLVPRFLGAVTVDEDPDGIPF
jgi:hypothetical protein